ncbi:MULTISPECIES: hypothetical protein [Brucella]|nr:MULTISPECIES: hypothetical protein [Brucella]KXO75837.1 hypothetical protein AYJ56_10245 [Brucella anthropi]
MTSTALPRNRRFKLTETRRVLSREMISDAGNLAFPMAVDANISEPVESTQMPGTYRYPLEAVADKARELVACGVPAVYLIGIPKHRDGKGSDAFSANGVIVQAAKRMKDAVGDRLVIIGDSYMGYFTDHMIGGVLDSDNRILDKETLDSVARTAVAWGKAGVDILCCSTMVDGRVGAAREALDAENLDDMLLMSSIKYNSAFFKAGTGTTATGASYGFDKKVFYLEPHNAKDALRIMEADVAQGAEMINIKPAIPYMDLVRMAADRYELPVSAYSISGDYAMIHFGANGAQMDEMECAMELFTCLRRAGADMVITYWAPRLVQMMNRK